MATEAPVPGPSGRFPTTAWSVIQAAQDSDDPQESERALNQVVATYWRPVFYFIRAKGYRLHEAEDLTQAFFLRFWQRDLISTADEQKGRFRNYLLATLKWFLMNQGERARVQERFERSQVSIGKLMGDEERSYEPPTHETPDAVFNKKWAAELIDRVRKELQRLCQERECLLWYEVFSATHFGVVRPSQERVAEQFQLTRDQVRYALKQVEAWLAHLLRAEVLKEVGSEAEVGQEIRELLRLVES